MKNTTAIIVIKIDRKLKLLFPKYSFLLVKALKSFLM